MRHLVIRLAWQQTDSKPREIWEDLLSIVAAQAGVPANEIHPEQRFADLPDYC